MAVVMVYMIQQGNAVGLALAVPIENLGLQWLFITLFFGAVHTFNSKFDVKNDPDKIEIGFVESKVSDHSGIEALTNLVDKYADAGKSVTLKHLSSECKTLLLKANPGLDAIIETSIDDPRYHVVTDMMDAEV